MGAENRDRSGRQSAGFATDSFGYDLEAAGHVFQGQMRMLSRSQQGQDPDHVEIVFGDRGVSWLDKLAGVGRDHLFRPLTGRQQVGDLGDDVMADLLGVDGTDQRAVAARQEVVPQFLPPHDAQPRCLIEFLRQRPRPAGA